MCRGVYTSGLVRRTARCVKLITNSWRSNARSFSAAQGSCHYSRITAAVNHGDDNDGILVRRVSNEIIADELKAKRTRGEIRALMSEMRKLGELTDGLQNFLAKTCCRSGIVGCNELPYFGDVLRCAGMKIESLVAFHFGGSGENYSRGLRLRRSVSRPCTSSKKRSPSTGLTRPLFSSS